MRAVVLSIIDNFAINVAHAGKHKIPATWLPGMVGVMPVFKDKASADQYRKSVGGCGLILLADDLSGPAIATMMPEGSA